MATEIRDFAGLDKKTQRRYPWDEWTNGSGWMLYRGVDFDQPVDQFRNRMFGVAQSRGLKVRTEKGVLQRDAWPEEIKEQLGGEEVETLLIQFYDPTVEAETSNGNGNG